MSTCFLLIMMLFLSPILGQFLEEDTQRRYSRSVVNMDELLKLEEELAVNLEGYIAALVKKQKTISKGIKVLRRRHNFEEELTKFWENPINTYSLIRHMQSDWHMWQLFMEKPIGLEQIAFLESKKPMMPQEYDFKDAAEGLTRMQWTYDLLENDISQGLLDGVQYNSTLTALDCFALAEHLINSWRWASAEKWILEGIYALQRPDPQTEMQKLRGLTPALLYRTLARARVDEGEVKEALTAYRVALYLSPQDAELWQESYTLEQRVLALPGVQPLKQEPEDLYEDDVGLPKCCSGRCPLPSALRLYCLWNTKSHPFLRLAAIKTEVLSLDPYVVLFHDVVPEAERALIRSSSKAHLLPSSTINLDTDKFEILQFRTSKSVWFDRDDNKATQRLSVFLQDATGLDMEQSEFFQVINYGVGGLFGSHLDSLLEDENRFQGTKDRLATALFYLSEVPQGGATIFQSLNLTIFPQPGAALFWYNLDTKGNEHQLTRHAGCPVIVGSKWVMSKWIYDEGQELRNPCTIQDGM